jgi:hypothetical protein
MPTIVFSRRPSGRRAVWAVRRFDSVVLSEVPGVVLCLCFQGDGAFLSITPQRYNQRAPRLGARGPSTVSQIIGRGAWRFSREMSFG